MQHPPALKDIVFSAWHFYYVGPWQEGSVQGWGGGRIFFF